MQVNMLHLVSARYARNRAKRSNSMCETRLFLKMTPNEHNILNVAKSKMGAHTYRELITTLLEGEYIDCLCNSVLIEKALRKIIVNLRQIAKGCLEDESYKALMTLILKVTSLLTDWNNKQIQPIFYNRAETTELQIRLMNEEKAIVKAAKDSAGFRTYCDLVMCLCCAFISNTFNLSLPLDSTAFSEVGTALNREAKYFNAYGKINETSLNNILDELYDLVNELNDSFIGTGESNVSEY